MYDWCSFRLSPRRAMLCPAPAPWPALRKTSAVIYLLDNPLLREPLRLEHVKPRLLGHWGTTPGPELRLRAPEPGHPRARPRRDLRHRPRPRRPGPRRQHLPRGHLQRGLPATSRRDEEGMRRLFRQFSFPGGIPSHVAPETPGSIHEGGELGYALVARLRRRVRQPRPARVLRGRRRRGRDRPAGRELALEQVPQPGARRRGAADPAPQRLQDRQPDGARAHPATTSCARCWRATATRRASSRATSPTAMHRLMAATLDEVARRDRRDPARGARGRRAPSARAGR